MSAEFSGGYGSIRGQSGGNQDDRGSSGGYQSEVSFINWDQRAYLPAKADNQFNEGIRKMNMKEDAAAFFFHIRLPNSDDKQVLFLLDVNNYVIFQSLSDTISSNIFQINSNVQALERICKQLGSQLKEIPYDKLHRIQQGTNKLASETTVCLKRMINLQGGSVSEKRKQRLQQERLKDEFENSISKYRNVQKKLTEKSKQLMNSTSSVTFRSHRGDQPQGLENDDDKTRLLSDEQQSQQQQQQLEDSVSLDQSLLEEREKMTRQLESDILDVNEIFRDLASIVHDQGEVVDSIEGHVIRAHDDVENANDQLQKASVYRRKARKKKCCLLVILLIVLAIIAVVIYIKTK